MKSAGNTTTAMARICSQFMADFLQFGQRIFHKGKILPQWSHEEIISFLRSPPPVRFRLSSVVLAVRDPVGFPG